MKKLVFILFVFLAKGVLAQDVDYINKFYKTDSISADAITKDVIATTGKSFKLNSRQTKNDVIAYIYEPTDKIGKDIMIVFSTWNDGENKDLGIKGTKVYKLKSIYGAFLDLHPFWRKYISSKLSAEDLVKQGYDVFQLKPPSNYPSVRFKKDNDQWTIYCW